MLVGEVVRLDDGLVERSGGSTLARHLGRDPLKNLRWQVRIHERRQLGLAEVAAYDLAGLAGDPTREFELFSQDSASGKGTPTSGVSASSEATTWG